MSRMDFLKKGLLDCDLTRSPAVVYLALIFFISRAPFIALGFSAFTNPADQDVLAVVNSVYLLRYEHVYTVSRFPGYPFFEAISAFLIDWGWIATNAATMVVSFISVIIFAKILNIFKIKNKAMLVLTFAFMPIIWINSVITMDYMWAFAFILLGSYYIFSNKYSMAGVAIGFAIGTRFTSAFMIVPIVLWALSEKVNRRKILTFISTTLATALLMFTPVFYKYKLGFLQGSGFLYTTPLRKSMGFAIESSLLAINHMAVEFGIAALAVLIFLVILKNKSSERKHLLNFCWLTISLYVLLYFVFPYKVAYLIPLVPWGLIVLNERIESKFVIIICILLLLNGFVSIGIDVEHAIKIDNGIVIKNYEDRKSLSVETSKEYMESLSNLFNYDT